MSTEQLTVLSSGGLKLANNSPDWRCEWACATKTNNIPHTSLRLPFTVIHILFSPWAAKLAAPLLTRPPPFLLHPMHTFPSSVYAFGFSPTIPLPCCSQKTKHTLSHDTEDSRWHTRVICLRSFFNVRLILLPISAEFELDAHDIGELKIKR